MRHFMFGQRVVLVRDGVPYIYRLTFKGWVTAKFLSLKDKIHIKHVNK